MRDPCMFQEVEGCIPDDVLDDQDSFMQMFQKVNRCPLKARQWCVTHRTFCLITGQEASVDFNVSGLPCWDYSLAGKRKKENGITKKVFLAFAKYHLRQGTPLIILENVQAILIQLPVGFCGLIFTFNPLWSILVSFRNCR